MPITDIRLIDHPMGRQAMIGWMVSTQNGVGVIKGFHCVTSQGERSPHWEIDISVKGVVGTYPADKVGTL